MTRLTTFATGALLIAAAAGMAGCESMDRFGREQNIANPAPCPNVIVLQDAGRKIDFAGAEHIDNVAWTAEITNVSTSCRYFDEEPIEAQVDIDFAVGRGPAASGDTTNLEYFVAVTRTDRDLIAKEQFALPVRFTRSDAMRVSDTVGRITIPRKDSNTSGVNFEIVVGLVMTREQVLYNRSGKSLKFPDLD